MIQGEYVREPVPGQRVTAGFFSLTNLTSQDCQLITAVSPAASRIEVHEHRHQNGMMQMRPVNLLTIPRGETLVFRPGGYHLMLFDLQHPLESGRGVEISLGFGDCGSVQSLFKVQSLKHE